VIGLYRGLSVGRMSVVAPVTAVIAAIIPVLFGLSAGERPSALALFGVVVALAAVALVSMSAEPSGAAAGRPSGGARGGWAGGGSRQGAAGIQSSAATRLRPRSSGLVAAVGAGVAFGAFFILLRRAAFDSGLWPLIGARAASIGSAGLLVALRQTPLRPAAGTGSRIWAAGVLDVVANLLFLLASRRGLLSVVAVLTSMYPASTVVLARLVLGERLTAFRSTGLAAAAAGVALIAAG
jgi:drug/metabolite transporter (DMT)-like permease